MNTFSFLLNTKVYYGIGSKKNLSDILRAERWNSIGICIDKNIASIPIFEELLHTLKSQSASSFIQEIDITEPTYEYLESIRTSFNNEIDVIIGIGGGSALDVAKGIAVLINNDKPAISYRGFDKMTEPVIPIIGIPTTAGTGSEITPNASFIDTNEKRKLGINGEDIRPKYAILDPELTVSCPIGPTISSGVDAIVHAHDCYISLGHTSLSRVFSLEGFKRVYNYLPKVIKNPDNIDYRAEVLYGAFFAAIGMIHSGGGVTSVLSYPLGVHYRVPHGIAGGVFLPHVIKFNVDNGLKDYVAFYREIDDKKQNNDNEVGHLFLNDITSLWNKLGIPNDISQFGYKEKDKQKFINDSLTMKAGLEGNPIPFKEKEIGTILDQLTVN